MRRYLAFILFLALPLATSSTAQVPKSAISLGLGGTCANGEGFTTVCTGGTWTFGFTRLRGISGKPITFGTAGTIQRSIVDAEGNAAWDGSAVLYGTVTVFTWWRISVSPGVFYGTTWGLPDNQRIFGSYNALSFRVSPPGLFTASISATPVVAWTDTLKEKPTVVFTPRVVLTWLF